jgi:hypothetical protein
MVYGLDTVQRTPSASQARPKIARMSDEWFVNE